MENINLPLLFEKYLQFCVVIRNYAPTTVANYKSTFKMFFRETNCLSLDQINKAVLEQWFFPDGATNTSAESFNAKLKGFRALVRGVRDVSFFLFRIEKLYAWKLLSIIFSKKLFTDPLNLYKIKFSLHSFFMGTF